MSDVSGELASHDLSDAELCAHVRSGEAWPLGQLWSRHHSLALAWARQKDAAIAEDVVSESFDRVFQALLNGGGPDDSFKAYLFQTMNAQFGRHWSSQKRSTALQELDYEDSDVPSHDERTESEEQQLAAAEAFRSLPERWQQIIYAVDVEGQPVQEVARSLDLTPNTTSALLKRAREGLRKSWLTNMHPTRNLPEECAQSVSRFGDLRWGKKNTQRRLEAREHVDGCDRCRSRWGLFIEQAGVVGLVSAGIFALSGFLRKPYATPTIATVAAGAIVVAVASALVPMLAPGLLPSPAAPQPTAETAPPSQASQLSQPSPNAAPSEPRSSRDGGDLSVPTSANAAASSNASGTESRGADGSASAATSSSASSQADASSRAAYSSTARAASDATAGATADANAAASAAAGTNAGATSGSDTGASANGGTGAGGGASAGGGSDAGSSSGSNTSSDGAANGGPEGLLYFGNWTDWCDRTQSFTATC